MASSLRPVTHCIFDMDGLLLDTETFYTIVQQQILKRYGKEFTWELKAKMMGKKALEAVVVLIDELGLHGQVDPASFVKEREALLHDMFPQSELLPGARRLMEHLVAHNIPIAVATSSHKRHFDLKTTRHTEFFQLFDHIVTGDQVTTGKPSPEIFLTACKKFDSPPDPSSCLVFEDAPVGVTAALAAGMQCVMVPDSNLSPDLCNEATQVLTSLEQFKPEQWGLPPFAA
jgi:(DL)-glycerol-3-phosphatase